MTVPHPDGPPAESGTGRPTRWLTDEEQRAWRSFFDNSRRLGDMLHRSLQFNSDMTIAEYRILVLLSESEDGSLRMSSLADGVISSRSRLTHQIRRMEKAGLVERSGVAGDGRGVSAILTDKGRGALVAAAPGHVSDVREYLIDLLDPDEVRALGRIFDKVGRALDTIE